MTLRDRLLAMHSGSSRTAVKRWLEAGRVQVNGRIVRRGDVNVGDADRVTLTATPPPSFPAALLRRVHEDEEILVVDKPPGLLTIATEREREHTAYRALAGYVAAQPGHHRLFIVHRLDRETSGLLVFAKSPAAKRALQDQFERRSVERRYVAVVEGRMREPAGTLRDHLREDTSLLIRPTRGRRDSKEAITEYRMLERRRMATVLELSLVTGRRGQIRAQLAALGHPLVGDARYGSRRDPVRRLCLHATRLGFAHPRDGRRVSFDSAHPAAFARVT
jgi:23S rRNA pseudouridine1911/1915/1917 synthase